MSEPAARATPTAPSPPSAHGAASAAATARAATDLSPGELIELLARVGEPAFRAAQIRRHLFVHHTAGFAAMTDLPLRLRQWLTAELPAYGLDLDHVSTSADDLTSKLLLAAADRQLVETVSIREPAHPQPRDGRRTPSAARHTICISSQVGCAMGCVFCASGLGGLARNLTTGELLDQVATVQREHGPLTNLVFMGMGEPLANGTALHAALRVLCAADGFGFSARRITVSTVGLVSGIERLAALELPVRLAVSLHAPNDALRRQLVPTSGRWTVAQIVAAAQQYARRSSRTVTFEYVLLDRRNDAPEHAAELARLVAPLAAKVNLIPYNAVDELEGLRRPDAARVDAFQRVLRGAGVPVTVRKEKGADVAAACGQLRRRHTRSS